MRQIVLGGRGIRIELGAGFLIFASAAFWALALHFFPAYYPNWSPQAHWLVGFGATLGLLASLGLREICRQRLARHWGMGEGFIQLGVLGAISQWNEEASGPVPEALLAVVGNVANFLLAVSLIFVSRFLPSHWAELSVVLRYVALVNFAIIFFNLIPAYPLDGGRLFRLVVWAWIGDIASSTRIAVAFSALVGWGVLMVSLVLFTRGNTLEALWGASIGIFLRQAAVQTAKRALRQAPEREVCGIVVASANAA